MQMWPRHAAAALRVPVIGEEFSVIAAAERRDVSSGLGHPGLSAVAVDDAVLDGCPTRQEGIVIEMARPVAVECRVRLTSRIVPVPTIDAHDTLVTQLSTSCKDRRHVFPASAGVLADNGDEHRHVHQARLVRIGPERSGIPLPQRLLAAHVQIMMDCAIEQVPGFLRRECIDRHVTLVPSETILDSSTPLGAHGNLPRRNGWIAAAPA